jgi:hypothetical protein
MAFEYYMFVFDSLLLFYVPIFKENAALRFLLAEGLVYAGSKGPQEERTNTLLLNVVCAAPILRSIMLSHIQSPPITINIADVPDVNNLDPKWLLARTIEVGLNQNSLAIEHNIN